MSLDIYLELPGETIVRKSRIYVRKDGSTVEVSREEWDALHPGVEPVTVEMTEDTTMTVFEWNITHNLNRMAVAAGIYEALWRPDEIGATQAKDLIESLTLGLRRLETDPAKYEAFNPENGWGSYAGLVDCVRAYLEACTQWPEAKVRVWR